MTKRDITLVVAMDHDRTIGRGGSMPWHLPADLAWFKRNTLGKPLVMGRRTWEAIGRVLPGRTSIVVTRQPDFAAPGALVARDLETALRLAGNAPEVIIGGGAVLYEACMDIATRMLVTVVHTRIDGDTWFPPFSLDDWEIVAEEHRCADERNAWDTSYYTLARRPVPVPGHPASDGVPPELRRRAPDPAAAPPGGTRS